MGEGKSSAIVPLVATALADSHRLVRVIVLKALAGQMFHILLERLSGLSDRRIYYLPFSRSVQMTDQNVTRIRELFEECQRVQGILVIQPEHILSLRLMVVDRLLSTDGSHSVAKLLEGVQMWLKAHTRDVLDESDEILHVKYQLIYTRGQQKSLEDSPSRWTTTQQIFDRIRTHAKDLHMRFPEDVEYSGDRADAFPALRISGPAAGEALVSALADDFLAGFLDNMHIVQLNSDPILPRLARRFITETVISEDDIETLRAVCGNTSLWKGLLLLRGLMAHGILVYVLGRRRWRVDYGLDPSRSLLAVPYLAKVSVTLPLCKVNACLQSLYTYLIYRMYRV